MSFEFDLSKLSYTGRLTIECFIDAGLDQVYITEKIEEFEQLSNYAAFHRALRILDDSNMVRLADKLDVPFSSLETTLAVLNKI